MATGDNMTGTQLEQDPLFQRQAQAQNIIRKLFPTLKGRSPKEYVADVTFLYEWESELPFTAADPLHVGGSPHAAGTATWIQKHQPAVYKALMTGDISTAKKAEEHYTHVKVGNAKLPYALDPASGGFKEPKAPGTLGQLVNTVTELPGATAKDVGGAAGGIGSLLGNHMVLVVLVVALILVMKK